MANKIYINWESHEYYTCFEDVRDFFRHYCNHTKFEDFLEWNYRCETIFNFSEKDRKEVLADYYTVLDEELKDWISMNLTVIDIDAMLKEWDNE